MSYNLPFELFKRLNKKGFFCGNNPFKQVSVDEVLRWLREERGIHIEIYANACGYNYIIQDTPKLGGTDRYFSDEEGDNDTGNWEAYDRAVIAGVEYILDNNLI